MERSRWTLRPHAGGMSLALALSVLWLLASLTGCGNAPTTSTNAASLMHLVGQPTAAITTGTNIEVTGQVQNGDTKQHDIFLQATLTDASGKTVGTATGKAEDVHAGLTVTYTLKGTVTQPTWSSVTVTITKVSENVNGTGSD